MERFLVSASTGAITSVLGKLGTMLSNEYKLLKDVRRDIEFLKDELEAMQAFLLMMADVEEPDHQAKLRANAVRELSYEIEDKIDKFMLLTNHESSSRSDGFRELYSKSMKKIANLKTRHNIAKDVKDIKIQVKEVNDRYARYKIDECSRPRNQKIDPRLSAVYKDASELVGIEGPRDELVEWISSKTCESAHQVKVASIVGYGGLGKTTLARQVYNKLGANFECRAFVSISRSPDMMKIFNSILSQLRNEDHAHAGVGDPQLTIEQIRKFLKGKRYFIIVDDIWDMQTWRTMNCAFLKNSPGSVIMTTTRLYNVAKSCCSSEWDLVYKIHPLNVADSKKVFFKRIFGSEEKCPPYLKEASDVILKKCGGLPLAINAISSLLATGKTKEEWDRMGVSIGFAHGKSSDIDAMNYILSLSYFDLPIYLRSCLLYLTMFPEDYDIEMQRLVYRWISEGLIQGKGEEDLVEVGTTYFHELVNRSLILPVFIGYDGKALCCRVHDTILDFLIYKSTQDNFCTLLSNHSKSESRVRRLSLMEHENEGSAEQLDLSYARSLGAFGYERIYLPSLVKSNALRVLDIEKCRGLGNHHIKDIGRLLQLRYLNIAGTSITELPRQIGDLVHLETLDASGSMPIELPESVTRLIRLARLFVPAGTKFPDGIGSMKNLQELHAMHPLGQSLNFVEELGKLTNLMKLIIILNAKDVYQANGKVEKLVSSLCKLDTCKLRSLRVAFYCPEKEARLIAGHLFTFPVLKSIQEVSLSSHMKLCWVKKWLLSLVNLEKLMVDTSQEIEQHDIDMVGSIPTLLEFNGWSRWIKPIVICSSNGTFRQLQKLTLNNRCTGLRFEPGAMPNLKELCFRCHLESAGAGLGDIGIQHLTSLATFDVRLICTGVRAADVEAAEVVSKSMAHTHPNHPTLRMYREREEKMLHEDKS